MLSPQVKPSEKIICSIQYENIFDLWFPFGGY